MKKNEAKEKAIKPEESIKAFEKIMRTYAPANVWPDVPAEVKAEYKWYLVLRDWLCALVPGGNINDYCHVELLCADMHEPAITEVKATVFTHTHRFLIHAMEEWFSVQALKRKPLAGTEIGGETYQGDDLYKGRFTVDNWEEAKKRILSYELVKVIKEARISERLKFNSHYRDAEGKEFYAEWYQMGDRISEHKTYELVGEKEDGEIPDPESTDTKYAGTDMKVTGLKPEKK